MNPETNYFNKIASLKAEKEALLKIKKRFSFIRLGVFVFTIIATYQLLLLSVPLGIAVLICFAAVFAGIVKRDSLNNAAIKKKDELIQIYQNELRNISEENLFGNGQKFNDTKHPYTFDLDIFGRFSLFSYINRTVTAEGSNILAEWLKAPSEKQVIQKRQQATKELSEKHYFKEEFLRTLFLGDKNDDRLLRWVNSFYNIFSKKGIKYLIFILPVISIALLIGSFVIPQMWILLILSLLVNFLIWGNQTKKITLIHDHINNQGELFLKYSRLINLISAEQFSGDISSELKNSLLKYHQAERELKKLAKYSRLLDTRYNHTVSIPLTLFSFWEIHVAIAVEKWFSRCGKDVKYWVKIIGEFDALLSLAVLHYNNPQWPFPEIQTEYFTMKATEIGHPLIPRDKCITNNYDLCSNNNIDIITGSNMAGKSTFLRTLGVNVVLALAGAPVCAKSMSVSTVNIMTSMRIQDSLEENISSFYAELERIKKILQQVENKGKCFILLDELLKGTNSNDRYAGSVALIKQFLKNKVAGLIATHDLQLTEISKEIPQSIRNFHFDVNVENNELFFDYKLKPGVCKSFNASLLMKKIGIDIDSNQGSISKQ